MFLCITIYIVDVRYYIIVCILLLHGNIGNTHGVVMYYTTMLDDADKTMVTCVSYTDSAIVQSSSVICT